MFASVLSWLGSIVKSKVTKVGAGIISGSGILMLVLNLYAQANDKIDKQAAIQKAYTQQYVKLAIEPIKVEIKNLKDNQDRTYNKVNDIYNYLLKSKNK